MVLRGLLRLGVLTLCSGNSPAYSRTTEIQLIQGTPALMLSAYDLTAVGLTVREYSLSGSATAFSQVGEIPADGAWRAKPVSSAEFATRLVVIRPNDPTKFNGTVIVEWLNVTAGQDMPIFWLASHREIIRKGYAYVAVSAQKAGIGEDSGQLTQGAANLKSQNPARYAGLSHPGDAYSYDIFSHAGRIVRRAAANRILDGLVPRRVIAAGESQSAIFLTTYINAIDPMARVYDGFFVHSRFGGAADLDGSRLGAATNVPQFVQFRASPRVPVMAVITETDLLGAGNAGYHGARREDGRNLRVWEIPGSSHGDNYLFGGAFADSGLNTPSYLPYLFAPPPLSVAEATDKPFNPGMAHHYVVQAALAGLDRWLRIRRAPTSFPPIALDNDSRPPLVWRDALGIARGGVRTPWVDVPTARLTGIGSGGSFIARFGGSGEPIEAATLRLTYPGGRNEYLDRFRKALSGAIASGAILPDDEQEILALAEIQLPAELK